MQLEWQSFNVESEACEGFRKWMYDTTFHKMFCLFVFIHKMRILDVNFSILLFL